MQGVDMVHPPDSTGQSWLQGDEEKAAESSFVISQLFGISLKFRSVRGSGWQVKVVQCVTAFIESTSQLPPQGAEVCSPQHTPLSAECGPHY